jgi:hypothetical protein
MVPTPPLRVRAEAAGQGGNVRRAALCGAHLSMIARTARESSSTEPLEIRSGSPFPLDVSSGEGVHATLSRTTHNHRPSTAAIPTVPGGHLHVPIAIAEVVRIALITASSDRISNAHIAVNGMVPPATFRLASAAPAR